MRVVFNKGLSRSFRRCPSGDLIWAAFIGQPTLPDQEQWRRVEQPGHPERDRSASCAKEFAVAGIVDVTCNRHRIDPSRRRSAYE